MSGLDQVIRQPEGRPRQPQRRQEESWGGFSFNKLILGAVLYFGFNIGMSWYFAKDQRGVEVTDPQTGKPIIVPSNLEDVPAFELRPKKLDEGAQISPIPRKIAPIWAQDSHVDIVVTVSPSFNPAPIDSTPAEYVVLRENKFHMSDSSDKRVVSSKFTVPPNVQHNGTLWGHFFIGLTGSQLDPSKRGYDTAKAYHVTYPLTQYLPKTKIAKTRNLLESRNESEEPEIEEQVVGPIMANYYHTNQSFSFIPSFGVKEFTQVHPVIKHYLRLEATGARDGTGQNGWYYPVMFVNNFWQLKSHMTLLNDTVKELDMHIDLTNMPQWKFTTMASIEMNAKENQRQAAYGNSLPTGGDGSEIEMIKEIFIDTNPILLAVTAVVSVAHIFLEMMAFGSDIAHYRKKKDNVGISVRSILANVFMQAIIFLYLMDNSQNTSWMILGSQGVGIFIELWKVTTVVDVRLRPTPPGSWLPYWFVFEDKHKLTETEAKTKEYDEIAFKYMYIVAVPLLLAYGVYSLVYDTHKSWYSFVITTLVGSVYAYGFLMMVPSLYINYRLKSVAHMPAKAMMYKFLNTFIDDLFAFTIKMPFLHRLATFRDDIIFFIYLYQKWAYKTDYTRVNEFGQGGDDEDEDVAKAEAKKLAEATDAPAKEEGSSATTTGADSGKASKRK